MRGDFDGAMDIRLDELKETCRAMRGEEGVRHHLASQTGLTRSGLEVEVILRPVTKSSLIIFMRTGKLG